MKAKIKVELFDGSFIWVLFFSRNTDEKITVDRTHVEIGLVIVVAISVCVEYKEKNYTKNKNQKNNESGMNNFVQVGY